MGSNILKALNAGIKFENQDRGVTWYNFLKRGKQFKRYLEDIKKHKTE